MIVIVTLFLTTTIARKWRLLSRPCTKIKKSNTIIINSGPVVAGSARPVPPTLKQVQC